MRKTDDDKKWDAELCLKIDECYEQKTGKPYDVNLLARLKWKRDQDPIFGNHGLNVIYSMNFGCFGFRL